MKVLFCNKYFYPQGGAEISMFDTARLLQQHGHQVSFFAMHHPLNLPSEYSPFFVSQVEYHNHLGLFRKAVAAGRLLYSFEARKKLQALIKQAKPDIVHLNNIYHQLSPSIIDEIHRRGIPMVMTAHDFKLVCPIYICLRDGKECSLCSHGRYYNCLLHRCTKGSWAMSLLNTLEMYLHHRLLRVYEKVKVVIAPSLYVKRKIKAMGFPGKVVCLPNFVPLADFQPSYEAAENSIVYFGRLSREKGLATLIRAVIGLPVTLKLIGDGPQRPELEKMVKDAALDNVRFLGYLKGEALHREVRSSLFAVLPSECPENHPRSVIESFALGKPVLGARIGGIPESVKDQETGLTFEAGNIRDLREKIIFLAENSGLTIRMGKKARQFVEEKFHPEKYYNGLLQIYNIVS